MECVRLRVQDIGFSGNEILDGDGKGVKGQIPTLPESFKSLLQGNLKKVRAIHERVRVGGLGSAV